MLKRWFSVLIALGLFLMFMGVSEARTRHFKFYVYKALTTKALTNIKHCTKLTDDVAFRVTRSGTTEAFYHDEETLFSDRYGTSLSQATGNWVPESTFDDDGFIEFWCDPRHADDATVNLLVIDVANGFSWSGDVAYDKGNTIIIDERPGTFHALTFPFWSDATGSMAATGYFLDDTGVDLPFGCVVSEAWVEVSTAVSKTMDVGNRAGAAAFISAVNTTSAGFTKDQVISVGDGGAGYQGILNGLEPITRAAGTYDKRSIMIRYNGGSGDGLVTLFLYKM